MIGAGTGVIRHIGTDGKIIETVFVCINLGPGLYIGGAFEGKFGISNASSSEDAVLGESVSINADIGFHFSTGFDVSTGFNSDEGVTSLIKSFNPNLKGRGGVGYGAQASIGYCYTSGEANSCSTETRRRRRR